MNRVKPFLHSIAVILRLLPGESQASVFNACLVARGLLLAAMTLGAPRVVVAAALPGETPPVGAAASDPGRSNMVDTDSIISERNSVERTRPFPVADKRAYFINIKNGDKVISPFRVGFGVSGMGIAPVSAGPIVGTGHHHILIDKPIPFDVKAAILFDKQGEIAHQHYKHFGKGETETLLSLPPGKHTLQLLFADNNHIPYYIKSKLITIEVLR